MVNEIYDSNVNNKENLDGLDDYSEITFYPQENVKSRVDQFKVYTQDMLSDDGLHFDGQISGLVAWYKLNGSVDGSWIGTEAYGSGKQFLESGDFNGSSYIDIGDSIAFEPTEFTICMWIRPNSISSRSNIIHKDRNNGYNIYISPVGQYNCYIGGNYFNTGVTPTVGEWEFITLTYSDSEGAKFYVNNVLKSTDIGSAPIYSTNSLLIGVDQSDDYFNGKMGDIRIYNRVLLDEEQGYIYNDGIGSQSNGITRYSKVGTCPILHLPLDSNTIDYSGEGHNGTWSGTGAYSTGHQFDKSAMFNGTNSIAIDDTPFDFGSNPFTITAWVNPSSVSNSSIIEKRIGSAEGYRFGITSTKFFFGIDTGGAETLVLSNNITTGSWYFVLVEYDGSSMSISVNNDIKDSTSKTGDTDNNAILTFGDGALGNYSGLLGDVRIFDKILLTSEKSNIYNSGAGQRYNYLGFWNNPDRKFDAVPVDPSPILSGVTCPNNLFVEKFNVDDKINDTISQVFENCEAYYNFDTDNTTQPDATGNGNSATVNGATYISSGKIGGAYNFIKNTNSRITGCGTIPNSSDFSINIWVKPSSTSGQWDGLIGDSNLSNGNGIFIRLYLSGTQSRILCQATLSGSVTNQIYAYSGSSTHNVTLGNLNGSWQLITYTYDHATTTATLYLNGLPIATESSGGITVHDGDFSIGRYSRDAGNGVHDLNGDVDEPSIWLRLLAGAEVSELWNSGAGLPYPPYADIQTLNNKAVFANGDELISNEIVWYPNKYVKDINLTTDNSELDYYIMYDDSTWTPITKSLLVSNETSSRLYYKAVNNSGSSQELSSVKISYTFW